MEALPELTRLCLRNSLYALRNRLTTSLQSFLGKSSPQLVHLELRDVPFSTTGLKQILSKSLRHLHVHTPSGSRGIDCAWAGLWSELLSARVELSTLSITGSENAMDEMLTYLVSYTGLQKLQMDRIQMDSQDAEDDIGRKLWQQVVPHHQASLVTLVVKPLYEGVCCYGPDAAAAISQCSLLRSLSLSICNVDSAWARDQLSHAREIDDIELRALKSPHGAAHNCGVCTFQRRGVSTALEVSHAAGQMICNALTHHRH